MKDCARTVPECVKVCQCFDGPSNKSISLLLLGSNHLRNLYDDHDLAACRTCYTNG